LYIMSVQPSKVITMNMLRTLLRILSNDVTPKSGLPQYTHLPFTQGLSFVQKMSSPNLLLIF
jgi:hypothetical protein